MNDINYIYQNKKEFLNFINETFKEYTLTKNKNNNTKKDLFKYQKFIRKYLSEETPYRGLLVYHGLGSGKTCTAVSVAENLKSNRNVLVLLPASLKPGWYNSLKTDCFTTNYRTNENIDVKYTFISSNASNTAEKLKELGNLDNYLIIVDESHLIVQNIYNQGSRGMTIYNMIKDAKNAKIIFLTGTPLVNNPYELAITMNMLKGNMSMLRYTIPKEVSYEEFTEYIKKLNELSYVNYCKENLRMRYFDINFIYESNTADLNKAKEEIEMIGVRDFDFRPNYVSGEQKFLSLFPEDSIEFESMFIRKVGDIEKVNRKPILEKRLVGLVSYFQGGSKIFYPNQINLPLIKVEMSEIQFNQYAAIRFFEKKVEKGTGSGSDKIDLKKVKKKKGASSVYRIYSRQFGNFIFPENMPKPFINPTLQINFMSKLKGKYKNTNNNNGIRNAFEDEANQYDDDMVRVEKNTSSKQKIYAENLLNVLQELRENKEKYLTGENLKLYSPKMNIIYEKIKDNPGLALIYSQFVKTEGLAIFSIVLEANGYEKLDLTKSTNSKKNRYTIYSGEESREEKDKILKIFTDPKNKNGEYCKIILISEAGATGLDLKNIRQVHIMEPFWNEVRIKQIIGRAVRYKSHIELPNKDRTVDVFRYISVFTKEQEEEFIKQGYGPISTREKITSDQYIYDLAKKKELLTNELLDIYKSSAVDCKLNKVMNESTIKCLDFGEETGISYYPNIKDDFISNTSSKNKPKTKPIKGILLKNGNVYFKTNKGLTIYKNNEMTSSKAKPTKNQIDKQVLFRMNDNLIFDLKLYKETGKLEPIGSIGKNGKLI